MKRIKCGREKLQRQGQRQVPASRVGDEDGGKEEDKGGGQPEIDDAPNGEGETCQKCGKSFLRLFSSGGKIMPPMEKVNHVKNVRYLFDFIEEER